MDAFDTDVLIYAAAAENPLGRRVLALFPARKPSPTEPPARVGSMLLLPELLSKPLRQDATGELDALTWLLDRIELRPLEKETAVLAAGLGAKHRLRGPDAVHLATAVAAGADRFLTNNRRHFPKTITEVDVTYPDDL